MRRVPGEPEIGCDRDTRFCTAAVAIDETMLAVWTVWPTDNPPETPLQIARRQGHAIFGFVSHGTGDTENFAAIAGELITP